jgi:NADH-quinone oxidoreductase subunit L
MLALQSMRLQLLPWLILFLPLLAAGIITLFTLRDRRTTATLSISAIVAGFALTVLFISVNGWTRGDLSVNWLDLHGLRVDFGLKIDPLSLMMLLIVTGVGGVIHIYSAGYLHDDPGYSRYFACLSLFTFSMLGIVLSNNFLQLFIFWELVGMSSYLLIGFWFERPSAADAAKKAFITNRLGDFGFLLGILMIFFTLGSLDFAFIQKQTEALATSGSNPDWGKSYENLSMAIGGHISFGGLGIGTVIALLIFCGAVGKSAQFPLHVWLPDAMEGPTPVSALIHAATMVAAGVYMLCRVIFIFTPSALTVVAWTGGFTALLAALIAVQQNDIKRILAYSTLSQLGYMVMAVGLSGPTQAMFHLTTHAFFKALLFLGAGSVIIALHHEQDIWNMGGLRQKMPVTFWTFLFGTLALCGVPPFSGFYSKDSIIARALEQKNLPLFALAVGVAVLTAFYMFRLFYVAFLGDARTKEAGHAHESPPVMAWPLRILAVFSLVGGVIGANELFDAFFSGAHVEQMSLTERIIEPFAHSATHVGIAAAFAGFFAARVLYRNAATDPLPAKLGTFARWMRDRFYFDQLYEKFVRAHDFIAAVADWIDRWIIEGLGIGLIRGGTDFTGRALRLLQTGNLQHYALLFALGVVLVLYFVLK